MQRRVVSEPGGPTTSKIRNIQNLLTGWFSNGNDITNQATTSGVDRDAQVKLLQQMIDTRSVISTPSDFAQANQEALMNPWDAKFVEVGCGTRGRVWLLLGTDRVFKCPLEIADKEGLYNDRIVHRKIEEAFERAPFEFRSSISIPKQVCWMAPADNWGDLYPRFPSGNNPPPYALVSEAIMAVPMPLRTAVVETLLPANLRAKKGEILAKEENKHTLLRIYLGSRNERYHDILPNNDLRNFPLLINDLEALGAHVERIAWILADTLAILHWRAFVDATDIEFVFGSSPALSGTNLSAAEMEKYGPDDSERGSAFPDFTMRHLHIWMLDFDKCMSVQVGDSAMIGKLVKGFWANDPYWPQPGKSDARDIAVWEILCDRYLSTSQELTSSATKSLPGQFITGVEEKGKLYNS